MQQILPKIELYRTRKFTEKLSDTFGFLRENWKPMTKYFIYIMLPISMVMAFFSNHFWNGYMSVIAIIQNGGFFSDDRLLKFGLSTLGILIVAVFAYIVLVALIYALIRLYVLRDDRLKNLSFAEIKPHFLFCMKRSLIMMLVGILLVVVIGAVFVLVFMGISSINRILGLVSVVLLYALLIVIVLPMMLATPAYMLEDDLGVFGAYFKAFRLGFATWAGVFGITFVVGLVTGVVQTFTMLPWYALSMIKMVVTIAGKQDGGFFNSSLYDFIQYLTCIISTLGYFVSAIISLVGITIQYGHACDKIDGVGVARNIEKFDEFDNIYVTEELSPELARLNEKVNVIPVNGKAPKNIKGLKGYYMFSNHTNQICIFLSPTALTN